ncbi:MAG: ABATE domain-containing protein [Thermoanaerobaculia bacterium]
MKQAQKAPAEHTFEMSGGAICLDFANTVGDRPSSTNEYLTSYSDLLAWGRQAGLIDSALVRRLERRAARHKDEAVQVFDEAIALRECVHRIFSALAAGSRPAVRDLTALNRALSRVFPYRAVVEGEDGFEWRWSGPPGALDRMLWPVLQSAAELLTSAEIHHVRECNSDRCTWLFVDRSRTHRRRWCDMKTCGNRAKARRHYQRTRKKQAATG